jgi:aspartyl-tRNA(Asn)/glutamyl-tRNA(Gln) amidotransferase subunit C
MSEITREEVAHLAELARIDLTEDELHSLTDQLGQIIQAVAQVNEVAAPDVPATSHPLPLQNVFREDVPGPTLSTEQVFSGAPEVESHMFRVPSILGDAPAKQS